MKTPYTNNSNVKNALLDKSGANMISSACIEWVHEATVKAIEICALTGRKTEAGRLFPPLPEKATLASQPPATNVTGEDEQDKEERGQIVSMKMDFFPYWSRGDKAKILCKVKTPFSSYTLDFNKRGNKEVYRGGVWNCIESEFKKSKQPEIKV